jgi:hypothetical protein
MTGLTENNDFLNQASIKVADNKEPVKKKRRTALEIEMDEYPEYYALTPYQRKCLVATNYWNVMYGNKIVEVPPSDTHYHKYFDKRCYDRYIGYQKQKKLEADYNNMLQGFRDKTEKEQNEKVEVIVEKELVVENIIKPEENEKSNRVDVVEDKITEVKVDVIAKKDEMPIEENKNFLEEKREHPVYPKREKVEPKKETAPEVKKEVVEKKNNKKVKNKDSNNNEQGSLF